MEQTAASGCPHTLPCVCELCTRKCRKKTGWLSGETYCAVHGRSAGWPCRGWLHPPIAPVPWHVTADGEVLCSEPVVEDVNVDVDEAGEREEER